MTTQPQQAQTDSPPPDKPKPSMPAPPRGAEATRVKELWLKNERDLPLLGSNGGMRVVRAGINVRSTTEILIQFEPWQRHHRVREYDNGKLRMEFCIHEGDALYVPEPATPA